MDSGSGATCGIHFPVKNCIMMTHTRHKGLLVTFFFMELFWLFAWTEFFMASTANLKIPVIPFLTAYFLSFATAFSFRVKSFRLIWVILAHGLMFSAVTAFSLWAATKRGVPFGADIYQWYRFCLTLALTGLFWYKGTRLCFRQMSYKMVCNYFDLGLALFFALLLVKLLVFYQSGIRLPEASTLYLLAGFFFTGLASIFFSNSVTTHKKQYMKGFHGIGVMISFCLVFLLCSTGLVLVLMPLMTSMADSGYQVVKDVSGSLSPYLITILRFILVSPRSKGEGAAAPKDPDFQASDPMGMTGEAGWFSEVLFQGLLVLILAAGLVLLSALLLRLFRFLMKKPLPGSGVPESRSLWSRFRQFCKTALNFFKTSIFMFSYQMDTAQTGFLKLTAWGRKSGVKQNAAETPGEYAKRLQKIFIPLENEIFTIVHAFHLEIYGEKKLGPLQIARMSEALKKIHSPAFWLMRLKVFWKII